MDRRTLAAYLTASIGLVHRSNVERPPLFVNATPVVQKQRNKLCERCKNRYSYSSKQNEWCAKHCYDEKCYKFKLK